jgi:hypothetical protein
MILLATNNELNSASDAQAALGAMWGRFHDIFYMAAIKPGGNLGEGIKYQRLSLPAVTMFAACAESAGYPALTDTHASNLFDWFLYAGISPAEFIQYGDSSETEMNAATSLWLDYGYYPGRFGNPRQRWAWSYYKSGPALLTPYGRDLGGTAAFIIFNDDPAPAVDMAAQPQSKLFRDKDDVDTGGLAILRDGWDPPGVVVTLLNRDVHQTHQHYDPNALSFSYRGKRFLIDHNAYYDYNDLRHGSDKEHSLVIIDQGGSPTLNHHGAEGCSEYGKVPLFLERGKDAIAVGDARYPAIDLSLYWDANSLVDDLSKVAPAKAAERVVFLLSDFLSTPLIAVADRYRKDDASHVYSLLFQVADGTNPVGDGTLAAPLHLTNSGDELFLFLGKDSHLLPPEQMQDTGEDGPPTGGPAVHYTFRSDSTGVSAQFVSLLLPTSVSGPRPLVSRTTFAGADAYSVALEGDSRSLVYVDNPSASELAVGDSVMGAVTTDATALVLGLDPGGHLAFGAFANYSSLRADALDLGGSATTKKRAALVDFSPAKVASRYTADNLHFTDAVFLQPIAVLPPNAVTAQAPNASPGADPVVPVDAGAVSGPDAGPAAPGGVGSGCACAVPGTLPGAPGLGLMVWALLGLRKRPARPRA